MEEAMVEVAPSDAYDHNRQEGRKKISSAFFLNIFTNIISFAFIISLSL